MLKDLCKWRYDLFSVANALRMFFCFPSKYYNVCKRLFTYFSLLPLQLYVNSKRLKKLLKPLQDFPGDLMSKYKTLPPIGQNKESKEQSTKSYTTSETLLWKKPMMPACLELPISISARTLSPEEYEILYQKRYRSFLINK